MKASKLLLAATVATVLAGCSSAPDSTKASESKAGIPDWVLNPKVENGIAAADCVKYSGNISLDRKIVTANTRLALAQQIETRVQGLDKTYARRTDSNEETSVGMNFSSVSKQITNQKLNGSQVVKTDIINIGDKDHYCALMTLNPEQTKLLFADILKQSQRSIDPQQEKFLYEEFKAFKAEQDLDKAIESLTD
ncbi:LPP20 family lipoprotein [Catenovulum sp. SM1970]|uniref:LPP20 family lipoprotein n=1 Tax=Marinifaba aquimaris TaxID=2741323 RepID=UPI001573ED89|nr:LPP20 family lipoprotein [Marinifaba aquimaris]NTS77418.1 LPP20 family lipoprotein [Marinifaba aquimaris]